VIQQILDDEDVLLLQLFGHARADSFYKLNGGIEGNHILDAISPLRLDSRTQQ